MAVAAKSVDRTYADAELHPPSLPPGRNRQVALRVLRLLGAVSLIVLALVAVALVAGVLYLVRPHVAGLGPGIGDALPLDELSRRSSIPIAIFLAVWALAAALLGLLARAVRAERLASALLLALTVGGWCYLQTGISILVVRQIPAHQAFHDAGRLRAVFVPSLLAAAAGASLGVARRSSRPRAPRILAWFVGAVGAFGLLAASLPVHHTNPVAAFAPERVRPIGHALVAPLGLALLALVPRLARRRRRAWQLAVLLLGSLTALHVVYDFREQALAAGLVLFALLARRDDFDLHGDPASRPRALLRLATSFAALYGFGIASLWVNRLDADRPFSLAFAVRETSRALIGLSVHGSSHLSGSTGGWFPTTILLGGIAAAAWVISAWLAPWRHRVHQQPGEHDRVRDIVARFGEDTLAPFALRRDKAYFFSDSGQAFLAYRVVSGVAIVAGDPTGPPEEHEALLRRFIDVAHSRDWRLAVLGVAEQRLPLYRRLGLRALYHGDEALVDTTSFSLEGRAVRKVRQSNSRLERLGYHVDIRYANELDPPLCEQLEAIAQDWRGSDPQRGFVMEMDGFFTLGGRDALFVIGRDRNGEPAGFLHFAVCPHAHALSLSSMPRRRTTPNGFNEWLISETIGWARSHGFEQISLNFAPFAALLDPAGRRSTVQELERRLLLHLKGHFQLDNLLAFNRKFFPRWHRRFIAYERLRDLPRVGIAALAAENYLPFAWPFRAGDATDSPPASERREPRLPRLPVAPLKRLAAAGAVLAGCGFAAAGAIGADRYLSNYWLYRGFDPPRDPASVQARGTATRFDLASPALGGRSQEVDVYLPPGYAEHPQRRYPVFYLLHGSPGRPTAFLLTIRAGVLDDTLVAEHRIQPLILVMPFGSTGTFTDKEWANGVRPHEQWETFLAHDVVAAVDHRYRTIPSPAGRAIGGLSEGGYGAINIALHHPSEFRVVESWSGYERADPLRAIFGSNRRLLAHNSPLEELPQVAARLHRAHVFFWFYSGRDDHYRFQNARFARTLTGKRLPHRYYEPAGGHNWALWRAQAAAAFIAAASHLVASVNGT